MSFVAFQGRRRWHGGSGIADRLIHDRSCGRELISGFAGIGGRLSRRDGGAAVDHSDRIRKGG